MENKSIKSIVGKCIEGIILPKESIFNPFSIKYNLSESKLMEGYYASYNMETVKKYLDKRYGDNAEIYIITNENDEKIFIVRTADLDYNKALIDKDMSLAGYFPSIVNKNNGVMEIQYEPRHQNSVNDIVDEEEYIYHLAKEKNLKKIMEIGLTHRTKNKMFSYPDRVYFFLYEPEYEDCQWIISEFYRVEKEKYYTALRNRQKAPIPYNGDYVLLKIDTSKIQGKNFFYDPNAEDCVYTKENIPAEAIEIERQIEFQK